MVKEHRDEKLHHIGRVELAPANQHISTSSPDIPEPCGMLGSANIQPNLYVKDPPQSFSRLSSCGTCHVLLENTSVEAPPRVGKMRGLIRKGHLT